MELTTEQQAVVAGPPTSTRKIVAFAGCGKTSTLVTYARSWPQRGLYLAFNRAIAAEAKAKFPGHIDARTAHGFAYRALDIQRYQDRLTDRLLFRHLEPFEDLIHRVPGLTPGQTKAAILRTLEAFLIDAGNRVKNSHCNLADPGQRKAVRVMTARIAEAMLRIGKGRHVFTHDLYLKRLELRSDVKLGQYDYLLLDEAQDLNPVLVSIIAKSQLPAIVVGDPWQSIYRFRGAVNAMSAIDAPELPLSRSWRFGPEIARVANRILRHSSRPPRIPLHGNPARQTRIERYEGKAPRQATILARTNARLFASLAALSRPFHLVGGIEDVVRQVGSAYALKRGEVHEVRDEAVARFANWTALERAADGGDGEARRLREIVEERGGSIPALLQQLQRYHRPAEADAEIIVSTAHKAKGREWRNVVVLDDFEPPLEHVRRRQANAARTDEADQEINLLYVACTRATERLLLAPDLFAALT